MNDSLALIPHKLIFAAYHYLPALLVLSLGGDSVAVGLTNALYYVGLFLAPLVWSRFSKISNHKYMITLGYFLMASFLIVLSNPSWIYVATFALAFFPQAIYFGIISEVKKKKGSLSDNIGTLEQVSGIAWAVGLILSFFAVQFISLTNFALLLAALSALSFPIISIAFDDFGIFKNAKRGIKGIKEFQTWIFSKRAQTKVNFLKPEKSEFWLYMVMSVYSIASGLIVFQLPTLISQIFGNGNLIYMCAFVGSIISAIFYKFAGKLRYNSYPVGYVMKSLGFAVLLASIYFRSLPLLILFYIMNGVAWSFVMMFFEYACLKIGEEMFGNAVALRLLVIAIFSAISGYLIRDFGFIKTFSLGILVNATTILMYKKFKKNVKRTGPAMHI